MDAPLLQPEREHHPVCPRCDAVMRPARPNLHAAPLGADEYSYRCRTCGLEQVVCYQHAS